MVKYQNGEGFQITMNLRYRYPKVMSSVKCFPNFLMLLQYWLSNQLVALDKIHMEKNLLGAVFLNCIISRNYLKSVLQKCQLNISVQPFEPLLPLSEISPKKKVSIFHTTKDTSLASKQFLVHIFGCRTYWIGYRIHII